MKVVVIAILLGLISLIAAAEFNWFEESKIVNGSPTKNSDVPYLVYLEIQRAFKCGGAMVSPTHVVSAAHCVHEVKARDVTVVGGATFLMFGGNRRQVQLIILPRAWSMRTMNSDITVLKLSTPMPNSVLVLPLCRQPIQEGSVMKMSGWGTQNEFNQRPSLQVQTYESPVANKQQCANRYRFFNYQVTQTMFCIANNNGKDTCQGDSGGPAVFNGQLCGVVSWGNGCAKIGYPGVYTDVYNVKDFVQRAMAL